MNDTATIAVLDDEAPMRRALGRLLRVHGYTVDLFEKGDSFLQAHRMQPYRCVLLDLHMPVLSGFDVLDTLFHEHSSTSVIAITGRDVPGNAARVRALGACAYLVKPVDETPLMQAISTAMLSSTPSSGACTPH